MARIRAALIFMMLLAVSLSHYFAYDLRHLDVSSIFGYLPERLKMPPLEMRTFTPYITSCSLLYCCSYVGRRYRESKPGP